ncbi:hypothetical protein [Microbacterium sp. SS28]|uniref:hypothetical protein n=1 Tax=Microbacterium sp. SS28 TaxID=2919948 RepID=UPI001FA99D97|nr:hypothetical protein [Microbacterium sp. SS28]
MSVHSPHRREVVFKDLDTWMPQDNFMTTERSVGHAGDVAWDLTITPKREPIAPDIFPVGLLRIPDLASFGSPFATFSGWIQHGPERTTLTEVLGSITQYWGRSLAAEWWWISAHQFDRPDVALEGVALRSRAWGTAIQLPLAYFSLYRAGKSEYIQAPPSRVEVEGTPDEFQVHVWRRGKEGLSFICVGREYGDFGDGIVNTLTGDLEIREGGRVIARSTATAGLERLAPRR